MRISEAWYGIPIDKIAELQLVCEVCNEAGGLGEEFGELELGFMDLSINDHEISHKKCWSRDPECSQWIPIKGR